MTPPDAIVAYLASFNRNPLGFVMALFPWGTGELADRYGPEPWQKSLLERLGIRP